MWLPRLFVMNSEEDHFDAEVAEILQQLDRLQREAEGKGWTFRPAARLARRALQGINWR